MQRISFKKFSLVLLITSGVISPSAWAYYQDQFNPNNSGYRMQQQGGSHGPRMKTFTNYEQYARAVRNAEDRSYDFPDARPATGKKVFIYDPKQLSWAVYDANGSLVRTGPGSAGSNYCDEPGGNCLTPTGTFQVYAKKGPEYKSNLYPKPYGGAPMAYAMFFKNGSAIHASDQVMEHNASHGCIRVLSEDAQWLNNSFLDHGSTVIIRPYY